MEHSNNQSSNSTGRIISSSLNLVNDCYYDPDTNLQYIPNPNSISDNTQKGVTASSIYPHTIDPTTQSVRRNYSDEDDDEDFITVTYKKHRKSYNDNNTINHHNYVQLQQGQISNKSFKSSPPSNNTRIIMNSNLASHELERNASVRRLEITTAAVRYAQTRYPFSPFIVRFSSGKIQDKQVVEEITVYFKEQHRIDLDFINYRASVAKCSNTKHDVLLYVKDANSSTSLLDQQKWPLLIGNENYIFPSIPSIPPQLSLIIENVDL